MNTHSIIQMMLHINSAVSSYEYNKGQKDEFEKRGVQTCQFDSEIEAAEKKYRTAVTLLFLKTVGTKELDEKVIDKLLKETELNQKFEDDFNDNNKFN